MEAKWLDKVTLCYLYFAKHFMTMLGFTARKVKIPTRKLPQPILQAVGGTMLELPCTVVKILVKMEIREVVNKFQFEMNSTSLIAIFLEERTCANGHGRLSPVFTMYCSR
jgi:hypothetical protein